MGDNNAMKTPAIKKGWMEKQSRKGVVRNWKKRFFVLLAGKIMYYVNESQEYPYGDNLKGEMNLVNTELSKTSGADKQIFITSFNGENNILMECKDVEEAREWEKAIQQHILFANKQTEEVVRSSRRFESPPLSTTSSSVPEAPRTATTKTTESTSSAAPSEASSAAAVPASSGKTDSTSHTITSIDVVGAAEALTEFASRLAADDEYRSKYVSAVLPNLQTAFHSAVQNTNVGETGNRGEKIIIAATVLFVMVLFGVLPRLLLVVTMLLKTSATLMITCGLAMALNAVVELKDQMSVLLIPGPKHKLVSTGIYSLARHPLYGGVILFTFGWAILQDRAYQVLLALAMAIVLNYAAETEEDYLEKTHPKEYPLYASNKKILIPFFY